MKAIYCPSPGKSIDDLCIIDTKVPSIKSGEILVKMKAVSLNPVDWKLCTGVAPFWRNPMIVGVDGAGIVAAIADDVSNVKIGDRVVWHHNLNRQGVFAEFATTPSHVVAKIPENVTFEAAAALPCAALTAFQALIRKCRVSENDTVLIQGASGAAGGFAVQICKMIGAKTIGLSRKENMTRVKELGADYILDYTTPNLKQDVREIAPDGVDIMFQVAKANDIINDIEHIRYNGQFVTIDPLPDFSNVPAYTYALSVHEVALGGAYAANDLRSQRDFSTMLTELLKHVANKNLFPMIAQSIKFEDIPLSLAELKDGKVNGKIVASL